MKLLKHSTLALVGVVTLLSGSVLLAEQNSVYGVNNQERAVIHFASRHGIRNWHAVDRNTLEIEAFNRDLYRAELAGTCPALPFAIAIGFKTGPMGELDKFSSVYVAGDVCWFKSFAKAEG